MLDLAIGITLAFLVGFSWDSASASGFPAPAVEWKGDDSPTDGGRISFDEWPNPASTLGRVVS